MNNINLAKWFISQDVHLRDGTNDANTKINKLVYFSNLMYYSNFDEKLNNDKIEHWDNGPVSRDIYREYRYHQLYNKANIKMCIDEKIQKILKIVLFVYGPYRASVLSDECHTHNIWKNTNRNDEIDITKIDLKVKKEMQTLYNIYKNFDFDSVGIEKVNDNVFYYDKNTVTNDDKFIEFLSTFEYGLEEIPFIIKQDGEFIFS